MDLMHLDQQFIPQQLFIPTMAIQRFLFVSEFVENFCKSQNVETIVDFGSNNCRIVRYLKNVSSLKSIRCVDINKDCLNNNICRPNAMDYILKRERKLSIELYAGSVTEKDIRFVDTDIVTCVELIEHLLLEDVPLMEENIFAFMKPKLVIISTPNYDYNVLISKEVGEKYTGRFRDDDHKFEWTRKQFEDWCAAVVKKYQIYQFKIYGVGQLASDVDHKHGYSTQIATFIRSSEPINHNLNTTEQYQLCRSYKIG